MYVRTVKAVFDISTLASRFEDISWAHKRCFSPFPRHKRIIMPIRARETLFFAWGRQYLNRLGRLENFNVIATNTFVDVQ